MQWLLHASPNALLSGEGGEELGDQLLESGVRLGCDLAFLGDVGEQGLVAGLDVLSELLLESGDLCGVQFVEVTTDTTVDDSDLDTKVKLFERSKLIFFLTSKIYNVFTIDIKIVIIYRLC